MVFRMRRPFKAAAYTSGVIVSAIIVVVGATYAWLLASEAYATRIIRENPDLVGQPSTTMIQRFGPPHRVDLVTPSQSDSRTGKITWRGEPYVMWSYYRWPSVATRGPALRVFIDDKSGRIMQLKDPFY